MDVPSGQSFKSNVHHRLINLPPTQNILTLAWASLGLLVLLGSVLVKTKTNCWIDWNSAALCFKQLSFYTQGYERLPDLCGLWEIWSGSNKHVYNVNMHHMICDLLPQNEQFMTFQNQNLLHETKRTQGWLKRNSIAH